MKFMRHLVVALALALVVAACSSSSSTTTTSGTTESTTTTTSGPVAGGTLVVGRASPLDGLQGDQCIGQASTVTNPLIYDNLLRINDDGSGVAPALVESWDYDEAAPSYTMHLRDDAKFSNGDPVTADDVIFTIDQWQNGPVNGVLYGVVASVDKVDDLTFTLNLAYPDTFILDLLTWCTSTLYPADFAGMSSDDYFAHPVSAGAFTLDDWSNPGPSEVVTLKKNPNFYNADEVLLDGIEYHASLDPGQQLLAFQSGELDLVEGLDALAVRDLDANNVLFTEPMTISHLALNETNPMFADAEVRKAIAQAINRDDLVAAIDGHGVPAQGVLPINVPEWAAPDNPYVTDADAAKAVLADKNLSFELVYDAGNANTEAVVSVIEAQLAEVGVTVTLTSADSATIFGRVASGDWEAALLGAAAVSPTSFDPISFLAFVYSPWLGFDSTPVIDLWAAGTSTTDQAAKVDAVREIQNLFLEDSSLIGLYHWELAFAVADNVSGFDPYAYLGIWYPEGLSVGG